MSFCAKKRLPRAIKNKLYLASSLYIDYVVQRRATKRTGSNVRMCRYV